MKSGKPTFRHRMEFAAICLGIRLVKLLTPAGCRRFAIILGTIGFATMNRRRDIACNNVRLAAITNDETEVRRIARASMIHFIHIAIISLQATGGKTPQQTIIEEIDPAARDVLADPDQGAILCSGHLGNWEAGLQAVAKQFPLLGIARRMNNPLVENLMSFRNHDNIEITPKHDQDAARLLRALAEGRNVGILFDQHAAGKRGVMVPFFGAPAATYTSPAMLHLTTKAPICFSTCVEMAPGQYRLRIDPPFVYTRTGDRKEDTTQILQALHSKLENAIREYPTQYLWAHRRWR